VVTVRPEEAQQSAVSKDERLRQGDGHVVTVRPEEAQQSAVSKDERLRHACNLFELCR